MFRLAKSRLGIIKDSNVKTLDQYEKVIDAMGEITTQVKEYGICSKLHPQLLERYINHLSRDGQLESFGKYMDIFLYLGTLGFFFIDEPNRRRETIPRF